MLTTSPSTAPTGAPTGARGPAEVSMPTHRRPGHTIAALHGNLDLAAAPALREHLRGILNRSPRLLILDLSEVPFCDAAGLAVLTGTQRHATWLGITVHLAAPNPQVAKLLHITGLDRGFTVHPSPPPPRPQVQTAPAT